MNKLLLVLVTTILCAAALYLGACGGSAEGFDCWDDPPQGIWEVNMSRTSGNCAREMEGLVNFDDPTGDEECTVVSSEIHENDCKIEGTVVCSDGVSYTMEVVEVLTWHSPGYMSGKAQVTYESLSGSCSGVYDIMYTKL